MLMRAEGDCMFDVYLNEKRPPAADVRKPARRDSPLKNCGKIKILANTGKKYIEGVS
jgi:hypothetical protein